MTELEIDNRKIGAYLKQIIESKYDKVRKFCKAYLTLQNSVVTEESVRNMHNRFIQIFNGSKSIQIHDLPYLSELLDISFEEIISAGKIHLPVSSHMTNYDIAMSHDKEVWNRYMKREDNLFLNCDEYCKSVIDYALEFKNYGFIKYLLDEKFIWLVDNSDWRHDGGYTYGAGTSIKKRVGAYIDSHVPLEVLYQDKLRTDTVALAIENNDTEILDSLRAREIPEMYNINMEGWPTANIQKYYNETLIEAISNSSEEILKYFSEEFEVQCIRNRKNTFIFPYLGKVIELLIEKNKDNLAKALLRLAIRHNKYCYDELTKLLDEAYNHLKDREGKYYEGVDWWFKQISYCGLKCDETNNIISYFYEPAKGKKLGFVSNIICVNSQKGSFGVEELISELNSSYNKFYKFRDEF